MAEINRSAVRVAVLEGGISDEREISSVPDERTFEVRFETGLDL